MRILIIILLIFSVSSKAEIVEQGPHYVLDAINSSGAIQPGVFSVTLAQCVHDVGSMFPASAFQGPNYNIIQYFDSCIANVYYTDSNHPDEWKPFTTKTVRQYTDYHQLTLSLNVSTYYYPAFKFIFKLQDCPSGLVLDTDQASCVNPPVCNDDSTCFYYVAEQTSGLVSTYNFTSVNDFSITIIDNPISSEINNSAEMAAYCGLYPFNSVNTGTSKSVCSSYAEQVCAGSGKTFCVADYWQPNSMAPNGALTVGVGHLCGITCNEDGTPNNDDDTGTGGDGSGGDTGTGGDGTGGDTTNPDDGTLLGKLDSIIGLLGDINQDTGQVDTTTKNIDNNVQSLNEFIYNEAESNKGEETLQAVNEGNDILQGISDSITGEDGLSSKSDKTNELLQGISDSLSGEQSITPNTEPTSGARSFYETKYPNGFGGIWANRSGDFQQTALVEWTDQFKIQLTGGEVPPWSICFNLGPSVGNYGCHSLELDSRIWAAIRIFMIFCAGLLCRRLVFGG